MINRRGREERREGNRFQYFKPSVTSASSAVTKGRLR